MLSRLAAALIFSLVSNLYFINERNHVPEAATSEIQLIGKTTLASEAGVGDASATAMLVADKGEEVLIVNAQSMPALVEGELYQVWVIERDQPYPAGVMELTETGDGTISHKLSGLDGKWDTIAIIVETSPNLRIPTGTVVMASGI